MANLAKYQGFTGNMFDLLDQIDRQFTRSISQDLRKVFGNVMNSDKSFFKYIEKGSYPKVRMWYNAEYLMLDVTVSGFNQEDVNVDISDGYLKITIPKYQQEGLEENQQMLIDEIPSGNEVRSIPLPVDELDLDETKIEARVKNGRLFVKIPRKIVQKEEQKKLTIKVQ